jgi:hypothetical protein
MMIGIYGATRGIFLICASRRPEAHLNQIRRAIYASHCDYGGFSRDAIISSHGSALGAPISAILYGCRNSGWRVRIQIRPAPTALDARAKGQVKSQMGVGNQQDADYTHGNMVASCL